jgi:hypothetical protein
LWGATIEKINGLHEQTLVINIALIAAAALLLLSEGCITDGEAEGLLELTLKGDTLTAKGLRNLILGLEERALSCDNKVAALMAVEMLRIAWKGLNG